MPRINVEDGWWSDPRRDILVHKIGLAADAVMLRAWRLSQEYWAKGRHMVPKSMFLKIPHATDIIEADLARVDGDFVYVSGTHRHHEWRAERVESGRNGGIRSGASRRKAQSEIIEEKTKQTQANASKTNPLLFSSLNTTDKNSKNTHVVVESEDINPSRYFIAKYVKAWQGRYGPKTRPSLEGRTQGQIKNLLRGMSLDRAVDLIQVYFQMDEPWFITKCHDFGTFMENLNKVGLALDSGEMPGKQKSAWEKEMMEKENNGF